MKAFWFLLCFLSARSLPQNPHFSRARGAGEKKLDSNEFNESYKNEIIKMKLIVLLTAGINCGRERRFCAFLAPSLLLAGGSAAWRRMPPSPSARKRAGGRLVADVETSHECKEKGKMDVKSQSRFSTGMMEQFPKAAVWLSGRNEYF